MIACSSHDRADPLMPPNLADRSPLEILRRRPLRAALNPLSSSTRRLNIRLNQLSSSRPLAPKSSTRRYWKMMYTIQTLSSPKLCVTISLFAPRVTTAKNA